MTTTTPEPSEPDDSYLVPDEDSDFDPEYIADDAPVDPGPGFVEKEVQDDGQD